MHLGGWFDVFLGSTLRCFQGIQAQGKTEHCRLNQRLIIGPWIHGPSQIGERSVGELDFGPRVAFDLYESRLQWYDYWLKNIPNGVMDGPPVRVFLMGPTSGWRPSPGRCQILRINRCTFAQERDKLPPLLTTGPSLLHSPTKTKQQRAF